MSDTREPVIAPQSPPSSPNTPIITETEPNLALGTLAGIGAALLGAVIWAVVTVLTHAQIGWMAVGVGFLVAWAVRTLGKGRSQAFGVIGAVLALLGCALGNLLSQAAFLAEAQSEPLASTITRVLTDPDLALRVMQAQFQAMDVLFYAIAAYEGFKFARRPPSAPAG